jgi:hypothetical protein
MLQTQSVADYFRVSQARDDMHAPELYRDEIERSAITATSRSPRSSRTSTTPPTVGPRDGPC